jgi:hypothetical protein
MEADMRRILLIALLALAWGIASSAEKPVPHPDPAKQSAQPDKRGTRESPLSIEVLRVPPRSEEERREQADERREKADSDWWLVGYTGALAAATILLAIMTGMLWFATKRLVEGAENTAKRQLRAYVSAIDGECIVKDSAVVATLKIKNSGQTPAYNLRVWDHAELSDEPPQVPDGEPHAESALIVGPGNPSDLQLGTINITADDHALMIAELSRAFWVGTITYEDAFGDTHCLRFSFGSFRSHDGEWSLAPTAGGNYEEKSPPAAPHLRSPKA